MNAFQALPKQIEDERRMSLKAYDFWRWHGLSPELAALLAKQARPIRDLYTTKTATDNANSGEFTHTIGLKGV